MFQINSFTNISKEDFYLDLINSAKALISDEHDLIANLANISSLLFHSIEDINWAGFYLYKEGQLVLGPFQGQPACIRIGMGKGVCGSAASKKQTVLVKNVHEFEGHIACDARTNSEIVVPIVRGNELVGVLDIDSERLERFDETDQKYLEQLVELISESMKSSA